jgi:hypothetical protein
MFTLLYLHEKYIRHMTFLANVIEVLGVNAPGNLLADKIIHPRTVTLGNLSKSQSCSLHRT